MFLHFSLFLMCAVTQPPFPSFIDFIIGLSFVHLNLYLWDVCPSKTCSEQPKDHYEKLSFTSFSFSFFNVRCLLQQSFCCFYQFYQLIAFLIKVVQQVQPQSIPKRPSDLFTAPLYSRSMEVRLSPQQQNSLATREKFWRKCRK